jgi:hypothetical protein
MKRHSVLRRLVLASSLALAPFGAAFAGPTYNLLTTIAVPPDAANLQPGSVFSSFDISFIDPSAQTYYVANRSNASVDIFSTSTLSFVGRATGFTGQFASNSVAGADGTLVITSGANHTLFAGDGNSTLKVFNVNNPAAPVLLNSISTGGMFRADELSYSPSANLILVANNADSPAYATLINATTGAIVKPHIVIPGAGPDDGLEQSVWNPATNSFFVSVPSFAGDQGGVAEINVDGSIGRLYKFANMGISACGSSGLVLGTSGNLLVGCSDAASQTVLLNPAGAGSIVATFAQIRGSDELAFDPTRDQFYATGVDAAGNRSIGVISDATDQLLQLIGGLPNVNSHSIAVDPLTGDIFAPLEAVTLTGGVDAFCPQGCIAVFALSNVPEPDSVLLVVPGLMLAGWAARRGRGRSV